MLSRIRLAGSKCLQGLVAGELGATTTRPGSLAERVKSGESVCAVARRHGLLPQQLFGWRRQARQPAAASTDAAAPLFVPAIVEAPPSESAVRRRGRPRQVDRCFGIIEVEIAGVTVRIGRGAEAKTVAAVLRALKAGA
jgi:transposase